jgi:23S rRNA pseudouridine2605 synthase
VTTEEGERLQKILSVRGWGSRRVCEDLIRDGRVTVNGQVAQLGRRVDVEHDEVEVDGAPVGVRPDYVYYLLNKPKGVVSTAKDTHDRQTVVELVPDTPRVYPVGRLDADSEGMLLLTNDGVLTHRLTHPRWEVDKEYLVHVDAPESGVSESALRKLRNGIELEDGPTMPAQVTQVQSGVLRFVIHEGRNRQIRRMCDAVGYPVTRLVRTRIATLTDRSLAPGAWRHLSIDEVNALAQAVSKPRKDTI